MKILIKTAILLTLIGFVAVSQFRSQPEATSSVAGSMIRQDDGGLLFGWFDPSRLTIHHSYALSYMTGGGTNLSLGTLTSSLAYQISNPLSLQFDISLIHSPYNNLGGNFTKNISGVYLTRAELNYRPSKSTLLQIQFRQLPAMYWMNSFDRFGYVSGFDRIEDEEESH
jgi:hypothetical protein